MMFNQPRTRLKKRSGVPIKAMGLGLLICASSLSAPADDAPASSAKNVEQSGDSHPVANEASRNRTVVPAGLIQLPASSKYYSSYAFVVDKKHRTLSVWQQTGLGLKEVACYPADLGKNAGDKRGAGDAKTPEGIYFLQTKLDGPGLDFSKYGKRAFTTDYPNFFDRNEGKTGSGIWLHAVPDNVALTRGSSGCVVVRNDVILDLTQYVRLGRTPLLIQESTELLDAKDINKRTTDLSQWLENWRVAWETKNLDAYMAAYGDDFRSMKMDKAKWRKYKAGLFDQYKQIQVRLSKPAILADRDRVVVRFLQEYTSDQHADFGEKALFLKHDANGSYHIVGEQWTNETGETAREEIQATTAARLDTSSTN
jgi:murein L,D-transpeptidase YafK